MKHPCLFVPQDEKRSLILIIYADDLLYAAKSKEELQEFEKFLEKNFNISKTSKINLYVGFEIERDDEKLKLHLTNYISEIAKKFRVTEMKKRNVALYHGTTLENNSNVILDDIRKF